MTLHKWETHWLTNKHLQWKKAQKTWKRVMCPWSSQKNAGCEWPQLLQRKPCRKEAAMSVEWINWWYKCFSLSSLMECEILSKLPRPAWGECGSAQLSIKSQITSKRISKTAMDLSCLKPTYTFPTTGEAQHCDGEHIIETSNGNHTGIVTELCIAVAIFCQV